MSRITSNVTVVIFTRLFNRGLMEIAESSLEVQVIVVYIEKVKQSITRKFKRTSDCYFLYFMYIINLNNPST